MAVMVAVLILNKYDQVITFIKCNTKYINDDNNKAFLHTYRVTRVWGKMEDSQFENSHLQNNPVLCLRSLKVQTW